MSVFTLVHEIVSRLPIRRPNHGGEPASDSETAKPTTWHAGPELEERTDYVERVDPRVLITGSKRDEWIEGSSVEVRR